MIVELLTDCADRVYQDIKQLSVGDQYPNVYCLTSNEENLRDREEFLSEEIRFFIERNCRGSFFQLTINICGGR
jgi:hypothetical protein